MKHHRAALLIGLLSALLACSLAPSTASAASTGVSRKKAPRQAIDRGPAETRAERDKRLARECKGRPNAGACEGYGY
ncbi:hypothetical protein [Limnohabitans sp. Jir72]|uniref:hypothetical protein n=1 Tax=Limnohabitans sp. Jir72 TaxID=1977909 RepID=UPI000D382290|nr:hypothetical protein [Limnohabitans sp. Jir72]